MARIVLLGVAHIHTPKFLEILSSRTDHRVACVWDHDPARAAESADVLGTAVASSVVGALDGVEAAIICAETRLHEELAVAALDRRLPLFIEKPLSLDGAGARRLRNAVIDAGVPFQTGFFMRGLPVNQALKELIDSDSFGIVTRVRHCNTHDGALRRRFDDAWCWMTSIPDAGMGGFGDLGLHSIDLLRWLMGNVQAVSAIVRHESIGYETCDEVGEGLVEFASGAIGSLAAGWVDDRNPISFSINGTRGCAYVVDGELFVDSDVIGSEGREPWRDLPAPKPHPLDAFLNVLSGHDQELISVSDAADASLIAEALYASARERRWVEVDRRASPLIGR